MKNRIHKEYPSHDCWGKLESETEYYPTPDDMSDEDVLKFAKEIESKKENSEQIFIDNMSIQSFENSIKISKSMDKYINIIEKYNKIKDEVEKIANWWAKAENNIGLDNWNELRVTDLNYADLDIIAKVEEIGKIDEYFTYRIPKDILFDDEEIKKWIKDLIKKKAIENNKRNIEEIDDKECEIEELKKEIEELKKSHINIDYVCWNDILNFN